MVNKEQKEIKCDSKYSIISKVLSEIREPTELPSGTSFELDTLRNFTTKPTV
jgi:hypothetical protein